MMAAIVTYAEWHDHTVAMALLDRLLWLDGTLDIPRMQIRERAAQYVSTVPSPADTPTDYALGRWVEVWSYGRDQQVAGDRTGKWLVFRGDSEIDAAWKIAW